MEVAVAIGTDPALTFAAIVPAPPDVEEFMIAGFLRQKPVELVKCETVDLEVPATPRSFSKATSISTNSAPRARSAITPASTRWKISIRSSTSPASRTGKNPIYATTIVGKPPHGGRMDGQGGRAHLPAADEADHSRTGGRQPAGRRRVPQPDDRFHPQVLSRDRRAR